MRCGISPRERTAEPSHRLDQFRGLDGHQQRGGGDEPGEGAECEAGLIAFSVDTLEFLARGGRIGSGAARIGGALQVKPILAVVNGKVESHDRVRTSSKAVARLVELAVTHAVGPCDIAVHHVADEVRAFGLAAALGPALGVDDIVVTQCGAVIAAHVGPGALAVVVSPRR